ncbi:MAG: InlB B-repeat-containing protein [Planctomycetota bacterium]
MLCECYDYHVRRLRNPGQLCAFLDIDLEISSTVGGTVTTPGEGQFWYPCGTEVPVEATPDEGYHFVNWTGTAVELGKVADPCAPSTTVLLNADPTLQANFEVNQYVVTGMADANGSINPEGDTLVNHGDSLVFAASPDPGYWVDRWFLDDNEVQVGGISYTLSNITADHTVLVTFKPLDCGDDTIVPDVVGMTEAAAQSVIISVDSLLVDRVIYEYSDSVDAGLVMDQDPEGGTIVPIGSSVDLVVSLGERFVPLPTETEIYTWTNAYPWSSLWISKYNWEPISPTDGPGLWDTALISPQYNDPTYWAGWLGPIVDYNTQIYEIFGPRWDSNEDQTMFVSGWADLTVHGDWEFCDSGTGTGTIEIYDDAIIYIDGNLAGISEGTGVLNIGGEAAVAGNGEWRLVLGEEATGLISVTDNASVAIDDQMRLADRGYCQLTLSGAAVVDVDRDLRAGDETEGTFEFYMSGGSLSVGGSFGIGDDGNGVMTVADGFLDVDEDWYMSCRRGAAITTNVSGGQVQVGGAILMETAGWEDGTAPGLATFNLTDGHVTADAVEMAGGQDGMATLNVTGGVLSTCTFVAPAHEQGVAQINLDGGLIEIGAGCRGCDPGGFIHNGDNWNLDICGGMMQIVGDVYDEIYSYLLDGHITACGGCEGRGNVLVDYNNVRAGWTSVWVESNMCRAWDPSPTCGATDQPTIVELCWEPGQSDECGGTPTFHIFLSEDFEEVNIGSLHAWEGIQLETCYTTEPLCIGKTYYWRVDTVFDCEYCPGLVWSFTVQDRICIEDMESYDDPNNPIWETWIDGCGDRNGMGGNGSGSCLYTDADVVHGGEKSMLYLYDNTGHDVGGAERDCNYSEATRTFDAAQDWTASCEKAIEVWFYGDPDNDATVLDAMYMALTDGTGTDAVATYGDQAPEMLADMQKAEWQQWDIALQTFADQGLDLSNVTDIALGFGDRTNCHVEKSGWGVMRFDDICLYPCRCVPKYAPDIVDLNGDCKTNWLDIKILAENWLIDRRCTQ